MPVWWDHCYGEHFFAVYIIASDLFQLKVLYRC